MKAVSFSYAGTDKRALNDITLEIEQGDFLGLIGPSGSGKSTLLYSINGVIPHYHKGDFYGSVLLDGADTFETTLTDLSQVAATVFQDIDAQMVAAIVEDEILFGLENFGIPKEDIAQRVDEALQMVGITDLRLRALSTLSGGQKQKVALAAVLALQPRVLLLDEPTGELDPVSSRQMFTLLKQLNEEQGITVIVVEQKIGLISEFAQKLVVMGEGELRHCGLTRDVLTRSKDLLDLGVNVPRVTTMSVSLFEEGFTDGQLCINVPEAKSLIKEIVS